MSSNLKMPSQVKRKRIRKSTKRGKSKQVMQSWERRKCDKNVLYEKRLNIVELPKQENQGKEGS